jgi:hypothetical protein
MRKRTGLRNKFRSGRGNYSILEKSKVADRYGTFQTGKQTGPENIGGRSISTPLHIWADQQAVAARKARI